MMNYKSEIITSTDKYISNVVFNNFNVKVCRYSGDTDMIILWVRRRSTSRREEGESLYEADSEEQDLVPGQSLAHALSPTHTEGYQGRVFLIA